MPSSHNKVFLGYVVRWRRDLWGVSLIRYVSGIIKERGIPGGEWAVGSYRRSDVRFSVMGSHNRDKFLILQDELQRGYVPMETVSENKDKYDLHHFALKQEYAWKATDWARNNHTAPWSKWHECRLYLSKPDALRFALCCGEWLDPS